MIKRQFFSGPIAASLVLLAACGGGGEGGGGNGIATPRSTTHAIGGSVGGLVGSLTLQNNGGDSLTLTANGRFSFPARLAAGGRYAVTVSSQPSGPDCVVMNGSGTVAADVGNVSVTCTVDPDTRFVPLRAERRSAGDYYYFVYPAGLYAFTTKLIERDPVQITADAVKEIALVPEHELSIDATVTRARPAALIYRTTDAQDGDHLWALDLRGDSDLAPRQIGTMVFRSERIGAPPTLPALCGAKLMFRKLDDPDSAFLLLHVGEGAEYPCSGQGRSFIVRVSDSPMTAAREVSAGWDELQAVYRPDGALSGILGRHPGTRDIVFFADESFTDFRPLFSAPAWFQLMRDDMFWKRSPTWTDLAGSQASATIMVNVGDSLALQRVDFDGVAHLLYRFDPPNEGAYRYGGDFYVQEQSLAVSATAASFLRIPIDGSAPRLMSSAPPDPRCEAWDWPVGTLQGSLIVWQRSCWDAPLDTVDRILSLPGAGPDIPAVLVSHLEDLQSVDMAQGHLLLSFRGESAVLGPTGAVALPREPSELVSVQDGPAGTLLQLRDGAGPGEGTLYHVILDASMPPVMERVDYSDGTPVTMSADRPLKYCNAIASGLAYCTVGAPYINIDTGLIVDLRSNRAVKVANSNLSFILLAFQHP